MKSPYVFWLLFIAFAHVFFAYIDSLPDFVAILLTLPLSIGGFILSLMTYEWLNERYGESEQLLVYGLLLGPLLTFWVTL